MDYRLEYGWALINFWVEEVKLLYKQSAHVRHLNNQLAWGDTGHVTNGHFYNTITAVNKSKFAIHQTCLWQPIHYGLCIAGSVHNRVWHKCLSFIAQALLFNEVSVKYYCHPRFLIPIHICSDYWRYVTTLCYGTRVPLLPREVTRCSHLMERKVISLAIVD